MATKDKFYCPKCGIRWTEKTWVCPKCRGWGVKLPSNYYLFDMDVTHNLSEDEITFDINREIFKSASSD
jgi:ribosomal protein L37AE/L43A